MYQEAQDQPTYAYRFKELSQLIAESPADTASAGKKGAK